MNLMEAILGGGGSPISTMANKFGVDGNTITKVIQQVLPALTNGVKKNVSQQGGLESLLQALNKGNHDRYLDDADALQRAEAVDDGNGILGHIFGSKDTSRALADRASATTGVSSGLLKKMLPLIAGLVMGALKKQGGNSGLLDQLLGSLGGGRSTSSSGGLGGLLKKIFGGRKSSSTSSSALDSLTGLLDADGESSPIDDILGFAKKLF
jgi:hypothetical protein